MNKFTSMLVLITLLFVSNISYAAKKKILLVVTNHEQLGTTGKKTGITLAEEKSQEKKDSLVVSYHLVNGRDTHTLSNNHQERTGTKS